MSKNKKQDEKTKILSTQAYSPIEDVKDGIVLVRNQNGTHDYVKIVEVSPINFNLRSAEEQTAIIQQFAGALRVMPATVQFKVVSTRADPANFVYNIEDYMSKETSPGCIDLQQDQIDLISSVSERQGITRRFYLIFRYEQEPGIKRRPKFAEIKQSLNFTAHSITHTLAACGNEEISEDDSDDYTLSVLYSIFSRNESERISFEERKYEVEQRYAAASRKYGTRFHIPVNDYIAPQKIDTGISSDYMIVDDLYYMFCYIPSSAYPTVAVGGWLQTLINIGVGVDVDFWTHKEDPEKIRNKLQYRIKWNKVKLRSTEDTSSDYERKHMRYTVHKVLINLSAEAFLLIALICRSISRIGMINGSLAVKNFLNEFFGLVDAVCYGSLKNGLAIKTSHFNISVNCADNTVALLNFFLCQNILCSAGAVCFNLDCDAHFLACLLKSLGSHIGMSNTCRASGNSQYSVSLFLLFLYGRFFGILFSLRLVDDFDVLFGSFCRTKLCTEISVHKHNHKS